MPEITHRYRVTADQPKWMDAGLRPSKFHKGDVLVQAKFVDRGTPGGPAVTDNDGDYYMVRESEFADEGNQTRGYIRATDVELLPLDDAPVDLGQALNEVWFRYYTKAAERLNLTTELRQLADVASALYVLDTTTPKES